MLLLLRDHPFWSLVMLVRSEGHRTFDHRRTGKRIHFTLRQGPNAMQMIPQQHSCIDRKRAPGVYHFYSDRRGIAHHFTAMDRLSPESEHRGKNNWRLVCWRGDDVT
jgi:hypothetical protein